MAEDPKSFYSTLKNINVDGPENLERVAAKKSVAAAYDGLAASMEGSLWNFGLHDDAVARAIEDRIPGFVNLHTDGFSEQLYFFTLRQVPLAFEDYQDKTVLEVGCGCGGGLNFLSRTIDAPTMVGLDLSADAVRRANSVFARGERLRYIQGDAEELPNGDGEVDVIINIESAHNYPDVGAFLAEVARVLKPGGYFSHVDLYTARRFKDVQQAKTGIPDLEWIEERDITKEVSAAVWQRMEPDSFLRTRIEEKLKTLPPIVRPQLRVLMLGGFGARFVGYKQKEGLARLMNKLGPGLPPDLPFESYRLSVARKR